MLRILVVLLSFFLSGTSPLVVVHLEKDWLGAHLVAKKVNQTIREFDTVMVLVSKQDWEESSLLENKDIKPIIAPGGTWSPPKTNRVVFVGGYFNACLAQAVLDYLEVNPEGTAALVMDEIFFLKYRTLKDQLQDNYRGDEKEFVEYVKRESGIGRIMGIEAVVCSDLLEIRRR